MARKNEKGVALILTLILLAVLSVMAVSLLFMAQSETWASMNYKLMTQARYGAEAGINQAANYIQFTYTKPGTAQLANFSYTGVSPVTLASSSTSPVFLSANNSVTGNYPVSSMNSGFASAATGSLAAGNTTITYSPYAKLLAMKTFTSFPSGSTDVVQTWEITSDATISGVRNGQVQASAILEQPATPVFAYAAFATATGCSALTYGGGGSTDSYDSTNYTTTGSGSSLQLVTQQYGGNVGTNGNLDESGSSTTIYGSLSTPRSGTGSCSASNVTALTTSGNATVTQGIVELPQAISYQTPTVGTAPTGTVKFQGNDSGCPTFPAGTTGSCTLTSKGHFTLGPGSYPDLEFDANAVVTFTSGTYNVNSILKGNGNSELDINSSSGPVTMNLVGSGQSTVVDLTGSSIVNNSFDPSTFKILYPGTGNVVLNGGNQTTALLYAPNATAKFSGGGVWNGAVIVSKLTDLGGAVINYDRHLQVEIYQAGNYMLSSFTWKKY